MTTVFAYLRIGTMAMPVGIGRAAFEEPFEYATGREVGDGSIAVEPLAQETRYETKTTS